MTSDEGGVNGILGSDPYATVTSRCLEPGYDYFGMIDPSDALTGLNSQNIDTWLYDPKIVDPVLNPPGNDILCLTIIRYFIRSSCCINWNFSKFSGRFRDKCPCLSGIFGWRT